MIEDIKKNPIIIAAGNYATTAYVDYKKITKKSLDIPTYELNGKKPTKIEVTNYSVQKTHMNIVGGSVTKITSGLAQEGMGELINYLSMCCTGTPMVGNSFDDILTVMSEMSSWLLGEIHNVVSYTVTVEYSYADVYSVIAHYTWYSSNDDCVDHYDGIHAAGVIQVDGWYPVSRFSYTYDLN